MIDDEFLLHLTAKDHYFSTDDFMNFKTLNQAGSRISFDPIYKAQRLFLLHIGSFVSMGFSNSDSFSYRDFWHFDTFYLDNGRYCDDEPMFTFHSIFGSYTRADHGIQNYSTVYLIRVSDIDSPLLPIPLPASLPALVAGLGPLGLLTLRKSQHSL